MRIGIFDPYLDDLGGGEKYMMTIAECLAPQHDVSVFWDNKEDFETLKQRFSLQLDTVHLVKNIFSPKISFIDRLTETKKYDVLIILSDGSIPITLSKKLFLHIQQPLNHIRFSSVKEKLKMLRVTKIFYNSEFTASFNKKIFPPSKSLVIYPPVDFDVKETKKENIIVNVGRFRVKSVGVSDYKKQGVMIDAFKHMIDKKLKGWKFILAASVKKEDEEKFAVLQKSAKGYPIEFILNKPNRELWHIYNKAKIYWHASGFGEDLLKHPAAAEHFGISTVEAMGAGAVPIVINAGGQKEIITDGENGFLWNTLEELQGKTKQLIADEGLWKTMSDNARVRANDFSKERFSQEIKHML